MSETMICALGFFDGVHIGHAALLTRCVDFARQNGASPRAFTFSEHPDALITGVAPPLINTAEDREELLLSFGIERVITRKFDRDLMNTPWEIFVAEIQGLGIKKLVVGEDFVFGYKGLGTAKHLAAAMDCDIVPEVMRDGERVSSTLIRELIQGGDMARAAQFLGRSHFITGTVAHGRKVGRGMGIPTVNLVIPQNVVVPKLGVYASVLTVGQKSYNGITNVGIRPTFGDGDQITVETLLFGFSGDLYNRRVKLEILAFVREERRFESAEQLKEQIDEDVKIVKNILL